MDLLYSIWNHPAGHPWANMVILAVLAAYHLRSRSKEGSGGDVALNGQETASGDRYRAMRVIEAKKKISQKQSDQL
jgi:hypothetical protein